MIKKRRWLTFMLAMIPGVGHLYLGFKKQGLQYMIGASICIIFIAPMPMIFPFALGALWFYQLFDALQKANWMKMAFKEHERMMFGNESFGSPWGHDWHMMPPGYPRDEVNPHVTGALSVVAGVLLMLVYAFPWLWELLERLNLGTVALSLALIGYGLWMLKKNSRV